MLMWVSWSRWIPNTRAKPGHISGTASLTMCGNVLPLQTASLHSPSMQTVAKMGENLSNALGELQRTMRPMGTPWVPLNPYRNWVEFTGILWEINNSEFLWIPGKIVLSLGFFIIPSDGVSANLKVRRKGAGCWLNPMHTPSENCLSIYGTMCLFHIVGIYMVTNNVSQG